MSEKIQAIVLAGGKGTRLAPLTDHVPKPLVEIRGKAIILYVLNHLKHHGITNVAISVSHMGELVQSTLGDGSALGMHITYLIEPSPMGTGGWTQLVDWNQLDDSFLVLNADNMFWLDLPTFLDRHTNEGAIASIAAIEIPVDKHGAYEVLQHDTEKRRLLDYIKRDEAGPIIQANDSIFVSSGWYVMTPAVRILIPNQNPISNEFDIWPILAKQERAIGFYEATEPWFDSGTHERLAQIEAFLETHPEYRMQ